MSWEKEVNEIRQRKILFKEMGGRESVEKHHAKGRLTVRERIDSFLNGSIYMCFWRFACGWGVKNIVLESLKDV